MFKKRTIISLFAICVMLTSSISTVSATDYVKLSYPFSVDNMMYNGIAGTFSESDIQDAGLYISYGSPVVVSEEVMDLTGVSRRLIVNTEVTISTEFNINDLVALDRSAPINYDWLGLDYGADGIAGADTHYMGTSMSHDELSLIADVLPSLDGILNFDLKYDSLKYDVLSSRTAVVNELSLTVDPSELEMLDPAKMGEKEDTHSVSPYYVYENNYDQRILDLIANSEVIAEPYRLVKADNKVYQNEFVDFDISTQMGESNTVGISLGIELKPEISQDADIYMPTVQHTPVARVSTWDCSTPTSISSTDDSTVTPYGIRVIDNVVLINIERTVTLESIIELKVIDSTIINEVPIAPVAPVADEAQSIGAAFNIGVIVAIASISVLVFKKKKVLR